MAIVSQSVWNFPLKHYLWTALIIAFLVSNGATPRAFGESSSADLESIFAHGAWLELDGERINLQALRQIYQERRFVPFWIDKDGDLSMKGEVLLQHLDAADKDGLDPEQFHPSYIHAMLNEPAERRSVSKLELFLSHILIHYATDVGAGRLDPKQVDPELFVFPRRISGLEVLTKALRANDLDTYLDDLAPQNKGYRKLRKALSSMRELGNDTVWPQLRVARSLKSASKTRAWKPSRPDSLHWAISARAMVARYSTSHWKKPSTIFRRDMVWPSMV